MDLTGGKARDALLCSLLAWERQGRETEVKGTKVKGRNDEVEPTT